MKSIVMAPASCAILSRSGTVSMAMTRSAPFRNALRMENWATGPQPNTAIVSPPVIWQKSAPMKPVGKMSDRNSTCSSVSPSGTLIGPTSA